MESELISFPLLNSIRTRVEDKQLVVLEKFPNSQENVKLIFLLYMCVHVCVVRNLVQGSSPPSEGVEMRMLCLMRIIVYSSCLGSGWDSISSFQMCDQRELNLSWRRESIVCVCVCENHFRHD